MTKILVIEDELHIRDNICELLGFEGFEVQGASNGLDGLHQARTWLPELIICDIMMPELDGWAVLEELRRDSLTATIPFIFLTAKATRHDMRTGMERGADDYLTKPFSNTELVQAIRTRLERHAVIETQRLRTLSQRLLAMQESERFQVARDLHTEANQILAGLKMVLESSHRLPQDANRAKLDEALGLVGNLAAALNGLSFDLRPMALDDLGLLPALTQFFDHYTARTTIHVRFRHAGLLHRFQSDIEVAAFRIVEEALTNVEQHTTVGEVQVQVWHDERMLHLRVEDQGSGFDLDATLMRSDVVGLTRMHGRAALVGGRLSIESRLHRGTTVYAAFPASARRVADSANDSYPTIPPPAPNLIPSNHMGSNATDRNALPALQLSSDPDAITIVIADNHDLTRQGMCSLLAAEHRFVIVGEATQGRAALELATQTQPAVLIVDFALPGLNGIDVARYVSKYIPQTRVLILSMHEGEAYVLEALKSGATGYALKQSAASDLIQAVQEVAAGRRYLSPTLSERAIDAYMNLQQNQDASLNVYGVLTSREREVLQWVVDGLTSAEIGERLNISPRTVEKHRANMMQKLGVRNQADLVRYALQHGFVASG
jgi:two-component system, NarL family, response regulator NreC